MSEPTAAEIAALLEAHAKWNGARSVSDNWLHREDYERKAANLAPRLAARNAELEAAALERDRYRAALLEAKTTIANIGACWCGASREDGRWVTCNSCVMRAKTTARIDSALEGQRDA